MDALSMLVAGHGGMVALRGGALAATGHGKVRREAHGLRSDDANLQRLPRLGGTADEVYPCARWCGSDSAAVLRGIFCTGEAMIHHSIMPEASTHANQALT